MSTTGMKNTKAIDKIQERFRLKRDEKGDLKLLNGKPEVDSAVTVAVSCHTHLEESWAGIHEHASLKCDEDVGEEIGSVLVQIKTPGAKRGRWIVYARPIENTEGKVEKDVEVIPGIVSKKTDDLHVENITIINTGGPETEYIIIGNNKICIPC